MILSHLASLYVKRSLVELKKIVFSEFKHKCAEEYDVEEHYGYIDRIKKYNKKINFPFHIIYNKTINFQATIACQTLINLIYDLNGIKIFDEFNLNTNNFARYLN